jgi:hypothetical protein
VAGELHQGMHGQERLRGAVDDLSEIARRPLGRRASACRSTRCGTGSRASAPQVLPGPCCASAALRKQLSKLSRELDLTRARPDRTPFRNRSEPCAGSQIGQPSTLTASAPGGAASRLSAGQAPACPRSARGRFPPSATCQIGVNILLAAGASRRSATGHGPPRREPPSSRRPPA